jgi:hypothetical protein
MAVTGNGVGRDLVVLVNNALPLDGQRALFQRVQDFEDRIAAGESIATIAKATDPAMKVVATSKTAYQIYVFDLIDFNAAAGTYEFNFLEKAANVEGAATI